MNKINISSELMKIEALSEKIKQREFLIIAADESIIRNLPSGNWIAGTIPYFMDENGGVVSKDHCFVNTITGFAANMQPIITSYDKDSINNIAKETPSGGFTITIMPANSDVASEYSKNAPAYENMFFSPIIGWISGNHLDDINAEPKVAYNSSSQLRSDQAVVMHVPLDQQFASVEAINIFERGDGPEIKFLSTGSEVLDCMIDGKPRNLNEYITENNIDVKLPLVGDYNGFDVNVSIKNTDNDDSTVAFFAPVFDEVSYKFARPIGDYAERINKSIEAAQIPTNTFSFNCILNFAYGQLEGKNTGSFSGPFTFGEIAYQLLNQTLVYLKFNDLQ